MTTVKIAETLVCTQHSRRLTPESRSYTLNVLQYDSDTTIQIRIVYDTKITFTEIQK
jgi:DNA gyrase inhibitor GyrI